jgi:hypothetical protein
MIYPKFPFYGWLMLAGISRATFRGGFRQKAGHFNPDGLRRSAETPLRLLRRLQNKMKK